MGKHERRAEREEKAQRKEERRKRKLEIVDFPEDTKSKHDDTARKDRSRLAAAQRYAAHAQSSPLTYKISSDLQVTTGPEDSSPAVPSGAFKAAEKVSEAVSKDSPLKRKDGDAADHSKKRRREDEDEDSSHAIPTPRQHANHETVLPDEPPSKRSKRKSKKHVSFASTSSTSTAIPSQDKHPYQESQKLSSLPDAAIASFFQSSSASASSILIADPLRSQHRPIISPLFLPSSTLKHLVHPLPFTVPTPLQAASWPYLLSARNTLLLASPTATPLQTPKHGSTTALLLPLLSKISSILSKKHKPHVSPTRALILAPSARRVQHIASQISQLAAPGIRVASIPTESLTPERDSEIRGAHILLATPLLLLQQSQTQASALRHVRLLLLDALDELGAASSEGRADKGMRNLRACLRDVAGQVEPGRLQVLALARDGGSGSRKRVERKAEAHLALLRGAVPGGFADAVTVSPLQNEDSAGGGGGSGVVYA